VLGASSAQAEIVYSGEKNISVPSQPVPGNGKGVYIDLETDAFSTTGEFSGYDVEFYRTTGGTDALIFDAANSFEGVEVKDLPHSSFPYPQKLAGGALIGGADRFLPLEALGKFINPSGSSGSSSVAGLSPEDYKFSKPGEGYVGIFFYKGRKPFYGWVRLSVGADVETKVVDWAYEKDGGPILAGATSETTLAVHQEAKSVTAGGEVVLDLTRQGDVSLPLTVYYTTAKTSTAKSGTDYRKLSGQVHLAAGVASAKLSVKTLAGADKQQRKLLLNFAGAYGYTVTGDAVAKITIKPGA
jgi:hypothetical protein